MPVQLPKAVRLNEDESTSKHRRDGEVRNGVLDLQPSTGSGNLLLLGKLEDVVGRDSALRAGHSFLVCLAKRRRCLGSLVDVWVLLRDIGQDARVDAKVLGDDFERCVCKPVRQHEGRACCIKVAVREDEEDLETLIKCLDAMGNTWWEAT